MFLEQEAYLDLRKVRPSISTIDSREAIKILLSIRESRRIRKKRATRKSTSSTKSNKSLLKSINNLSQEQARALLNELTKMKEELDATN